MELLGLLLVVAILISYAKWNGIGITPAETAAWINRNRGTVQYLTQDTGHPERDANNWR